MSESWKAIVPPLGQIFGDASILQTPPNRKKRAIEWGTQQLCGPPVQRISA